jgi:hypothetical protein
MRTLGRKPSLLSFERKFGKAYVARSLLDRAIADFPVQWPPPNGAADALERLQGQGKQRVRLAPYIDRVSTSPVQKRATMRPNASSSQQGNRERRTRRG